MDSEAPSNVNTWLAAIGKILELDLSLDSENKCLLQIEDDLTCTLELSQDKKSIVFYSTVAELTEDPIVSHKLALKALSLNLLQIQTQGGVLGLAPNGTQIIYSFFEAINAFDTETFQNTFYNFIEMAAALYKKLNKF